MGKHITDTCIAPVGDVSDSAELSEIALCGKPAVAERVVAGLRCALCAAHAAEFDAEFKQS